MRFDGTLGFSGGMVDEGETVEDACTRECSEELGVSPADLTITQSDHIISHYSDKTHFCLHFFAKEVSLELFHEIEKKATSSKDWGDEVRMILLYILRILYSFSGPWYSKMSTSYSTKWFRFSSFSTTQLHR